MVPQALHLLAAPAPCAVIAEAKNILWRGERCLGAAVFLQELKEHQGKGIITSQMGAVRARHPQSLQQQLPCTACPRHKPHVQTHTPPPWPKALYLPNFNLFLLPVD